MKLTELEPTFLQATNPKTHNLTNDFSLADGIMFLCPKCFVKNNGPAGTHVIICWRPKVSQDYSPRPGRWDINGTGYSDLTLVSNPSSSVLLNGGCKAHFHLTNGEIIMCE